MEYEPKFINRWKNGINKSLIKNTDIKSNTHLSKCLYDAYNRGGRRFRGLISMGTYDILGGDLRYFQRAPSAFEQSHLASVFYDLKMDKQGIWYGKPSPHVLYGDGIYTMAAEYLRSRAERLITKEAFEHFEVSQNVEAIDSINEQAHQIIPIMIQGQLDDIFGKPKTPGEIRENQFNKNYILFASVDLTRKFKPEHKFGRQLRLISELLPLAHQNLDDMYDIEEDLENETRTMPTLFGMDRALEQYTQDVGRIFENIYQIKGISRLESIISYMLPSQDEVLKRLNEKEKDKQ